MKLKLSTSNPEALRNTLGAILSLRKFCVLRFTPTHLHIISAAINEPQVWCKLSRELFDLYEVESIRDNIISLEINIDSLYQVLRNYEKSNSQGLSIRLQKKAHDGHSKLLLTLSVFYNEQLSITSTVLHTFRIPIRLLKKESDDRIREPSLLSTDLFMTLRPDIISLFKRVDRYKTSDHLYITLTLAGYLGLSIKDELRRINISWKDKLELQSDVDSSISNDTPVRVIVKLRDWKLGAKLCELSEKVTLILGDMELLVLHCYLSDDSNCEIVYFIGSINLNDDI